MGLHESIAALDTAIGSIKTDVEALEGVESINDYISQILLVKAAELKGLGRLYAEKGNLRVRADVETDIAALRNQIRTVPAERTEL